MPLTTPETALKGIIRNFIHNACHYNIAALKQMYHPDLVIVIINEQGNITRLDYNQNMQIFENLARSGANPINTETQFNHIEINDDQAQVVVTRHMALNGRDEKIVFSLYLVHKQDRWQIYREMAFAVPA